MSGVVSIQDLSSAKKSQNHLNCAAIPAHAAKLLHFDDTEPRVSIGSTAVVSRSVGRRHPRRRQAHQLVRKRRPVRGEVGSVSWTAIQ